MKKKVTPTIFNGIYQEYKDALQAQKAAEQNFAWAVTFEDVDMAIRELNLAKTRVEYAYLRVKQIDTPEVRKPFNLFKAISL